MAGRNTRNVQKYQAKRLRYVAAARQVMARHGFENASLTEISRKADVPTRTGIVYYFGNKFDLLQAVLEVHLDALLAGMDGAWDDALPPRERLTRMALAFAEAVAAHRDGQHILHTDLHRLAPPQRVLIDYKQELVIASFRDDMEAVVAAAGGPPALGVVLTLSLLNLLAGHPRWLRDDGAVARADWARMMVAAVLWTAEGGAGARVPETGVAAEMPAAEAPAAVKPEAGSAAAEIGPGARAARRPGRRARLPQAAA